MTIVIIALIVFGIGTGKLVIETFKKPTAIKVIASISFLVLYGGAIIWALNKFSN